MCIQIYAYMYTHLCIYIYCIISYHIISYHIISYYIVLYYTIMFYIIYIEVYIHIHIHTYHMLVQACVEAVLPLQAEYPVRVPAWKL